MKCLTLHSNHRSNMFYEFVLIHLCWWHLIGVFGETLSVMEGDSVTLNSGVTDIQDDDNLLWKFGAENSPIAQMSVEKQIFPDGRFRDRLKLDNQTGSLTITDITTEQSGHYELEIDGAMWSSKTFSVSVYARLSVPVIIRVYPQNLASSPSSVQYCSVVCLVVNVSAVSLSWYKGNSLLSSISVSDLSISLSLPLEVEYQDNNTYSCVISNILSNRVKQLNITQLCQTHRNYSDEGLPLLNLVLISAAGPLFIVAAIIMCCICKKCRKTDQKDEENITHLMPCKPKARTKKRKMEAVYENVPKNR